MAANLTAALSADGLLRIEGTEQPDTIAVRQDGGQISISGLPQLFAVEHVKRIHVQGLAGNDTIDVRGVCLPVMLDAGFGADQLLVSPASPAVLAGMQGGDLLEFDAPVARSCTGSDGRLIALTTSGNLYVQGRLIGSSVRTFTLDDAQANEGFFLDTRGDVFHWNALGTKTRWGSNVQSIAPAADSGGLFILTGGNVYHWDAAGNANCWGRNVQSLSPAGNGQVIWSGVRDFVVDNARADAGFFLDVRGDVYRWDSQGATVRWGSNVQSIAPAADPGGLFILTGGTVYHWDATGNAVRWGSNIQSIAPAGNGRLFVLDGAGNVYRWEHTMVSAHWGSNVKSIAPAADPGGLFIHTGDVVYHWDANGKADYWGRNIKSMVPAGEGRLFVLAGDGSVYRWAADMVSSRWGSNIQSIAPAADRGGLFILYGGTVYHWDANGKTDYWGTNLRQIAPAGGGQLYVLDGAGNVYCWDAFGTSRLIASDVKSLVVDGAQVHFTSLKDGTLTIRGTLTGDEIIVSTGGVWSFSGGGGWQVRDGRLHVSVNGREVLSAARGEVQRIVIAAGEGHDMVVFRGDTWSELQVVIDAGAGNDLVQATTAGSCLIDGGAGNDDITSGQLADVIFGGAGNDRLVGSGGNDLMDGGDGDDWLSGCDGDDVLNAGPTGNDWLDAWYDGTGGDDTYIVAGATAKDDVHEYRKLYRAGGIVHVREDNKGEDQLYWGSGTLYLGAGYHDRMDDDGFWSSLGGIVEAVSSTVVKFVELSIRFDLAVAEKIGTSFLRGLAQYRGHRTDGDNKDWIPGEFGEPHPGDITGDWDKNDSDKAPGDVWGGPSNDGETVVSPPEPINGGS